MEMACILLQASASPLRQVSVARQRGVVTVLMAISLLALLVMVGLALDTGNIMINKTRLQNAVDAAALAAAKRFDEMGNAASATDEAKNVFLLNATANGNTALKEAWKSGAGSIQLEVKYSTTLPPFTSNTTQGPYVRVRASGFQVDTWLVHLVGVEHATLSTSAVAGPQPVSTVHNPVPLMVCGDPAAGEGNHWGYTLNQVVVLKNSDTSCGSAVGKGNFQLLALGGTGADQVRNNLAGGFDQPVSAGSTVLTEPGNVVGPVLQGLNTRFGSYQGSMHGLEAIYPPDVIIDQQPNPGLSTQCVSGQQRIKLGSKEITSSNIDELYNYSDYTSDLANPAVYDYQPHSNSGIGAYDRRMLAVPVVNCENTSGGRGSVPVLGFGCFWLLQPILKGGSSSYIYGEFVEECAVSGSGGAGTGSLDGPHIIVLYNDPLGTGS